MSNKKDKEKLDAEILALFLFMLKYSDSKEFKKLLLSYKNHREDLKVQINKIYAKYSKDNELKISSSEVTFEIKKLEPKLKSIGSTLSQEENSILAYILLQVCNDTFIKTNNILIKYSDVNSLKSQLTKVQVDKIINTKIDNLNNKMRNNKNKEKLINKLNRDIKNNLKKGLSIEKINKIIDKDFSEGAFVSKRLIENEIAIDFNKSLIESYKANNIQKVEFSAILDERTTEQCESLNGEIFNIEDAPTPPLHIFCRSTLLPII